MDVPGGYVFLGRLDMRGGDARGRYCGVSLGWCADWCDSLGSACAAITYVGDQGDATGSKCCYPKARGPCVCRSWGNQGRGLSPGQGVRGVGVFVGKGSVGSVYPGARGPCMCPWRGNQRWGEGQRAPNSAAPRRALCATHITAQQQQPMRLSGTSGCAPEGWGPPTHPTHDAAAAVAEDWKGRRARTAVAPNFRQG
eukprot:366299-Chlamydomonas_euryale.AAC.8